MLKNSNVHSFCTGIDFGGVSETLNRSIVSKEVQDDKYLNDLVKFALEFDDNIVAPIESEFYLGSHVFDAKPSFQTSFGEGVSTAP